MKKAIYTRTEITRQGLLFILSIFFCLSCEDFIEIDPPKSQLIKETVFEDAATAEAALLNIYGEVRNNLVINQRGIFALNLLSGLYADELVNYTVQNSQENFYNNNLDPRESYINQLWNNSYNLIYASNSVIEGAETSSLEETVKSQLVGEAKFLRAFFHLYLTNFFGAIPYISSASYSENMEAEKISTEEVLALVIADLESSIALLDYSDVSAERVRPNRAAAEALLARVYLYQKNWEMAEELSTSVIENSEYQWNDDLSTVFLKNSSSTIWQLKTEDATIATLEAINYIFETAPPVSVALSSYLIDSFTEEDERFESWVGQVSDGENTYYYPYKYKTQASATEADEYSIQLRLAELYLIRAEARVHLDDFGGAQLDINKIRQRAGLLPISSTNETELIDFIIQERYLELFLEYPHRFFDLKRTDRTQILANRKTGWDENDVLWPIPESELIVNPNLLPQNPGY